MVAIITGRTYSEESVVSIIILKYQYYLPYGWNPSCLQTTLELDDSQ